MIRVLVVDDSAFMRKLVSEILNEQPDMQVVATARNGQDAIDKLRSLDADVITLDVEMPVMDGVEALQYIMEHHPKPVVMLSSLTKRGSDTTIKALSYGAVDFIAKPSGSISLDLKMVSDEIAKKVRTASEARLPQLPKRIAGTISRQKPPDAIVPVGRGNANIVVAIGSSTGGPKAVEEVFHYLPSDLKAAILVIQHMPKGFTRSFAERLNSLSAITVKEAETGDLLENGKALIAPGDFHMTVSPNKQIVLNQDPPVQFLRPSIDVTMQTLPPIFGKKVIGVVLTGMGRDGARGMAMIKEFAGKTIAQDRATSTIYSMPRVVFEEGNADYVLPLERIGESIVKLVNTLQ